jgi:hypothetical protein
VLFFDAPCLERDSIGVETGNGQGGFDERTSFSCFWFLFLRILKCRLINAGHARWQVWKLVWLDRRGWSQTLERWCSSQRAAGGVCWLACAYLDEVAESIKDTHCRANMRLRSRAHWICAAQSKVSWSAASTSTSTRHRWRSQSGGTSMERDAIERRMTLRSCQQTAISFRVLCTRRNRPSTYSASQLLVLGLLLGERAMRLGFAALGKSRYPRNTTATN